MTVVRVCYLRPWDVNLSPVEDSIQDDGQGSVGVPLHCHEGQVVILHQALHHLVSVWDGGSLLIRLNTYVYVYGHCQS